MNLTVLTAYYENPGLADTLIDSCCTFNLNLRVAHAAAFNGSWQGDMRTGKLIAVLETISSLKKERFDHVLWADGFDTFACFGKDEIEHRWKLLGCPPMLFSGEKNCWPDEDRRPLYPESPSLWRFINAGTWLAQIDYLHDAITGILARSEGSGEENDQRLWTTAFLNKNLPGAQIDTGRLIFQTMWGTDISEVVDTCFLHYNGGVWRDPDAKRKYLEHWATLKKQRGVSIHERHWVKAP